MYAEGLFVSRQKKQVNVYGRNKIQGFKVKIQSPWGKDGKDKDKKRKACPTRKKAPQKYSPASRRTHNKSTKYRFNMERCKKDYERKIQY